LLDSQSGLVGYFKLNGSLGFLLDDLRARRYSTRLRDTNQPKFDQITAARLGVYRQIEWGEVASFFVNMKPNL
jgi:hypothetical protein